MITVWNWKLVRNLRIQYLLTLSFGERCLLMFLGKQCDSYDIDILVSVSFSVKLIVTNTLMCGLCHRVH